MANVAKRRAENRCRYNLADVRTAVRGRCDKTRGLDKNVCLDAKKKETREEQCPVGTS